MPGILLTLSRRPDVELAKNLAAALGELTSEILHKELERTAVFIRHIPKELWFIAGRSLAERGMDSFRLEVTITDETNTRAEKALFQRAAFARLCEILGDVHPHSNVHIIDCRATAYGYGGKTQAERLSLVESQERGAG